MTTCLDPITNYLHVWPYACTLLALPQYIWWMLWPEELGYQAGDQARSQTSTTCTLAGSKHRREHYSAGRFLLLRWYGWTSYHPAYET